MYFCSECIQTNTSPPVHQLCNFPINARDFTEIHFMNSCLNHLPGCSICKIVVAYGWLIYFAGDRNSRLDQINTNQIPPGTVGTNQFIYVEGGSAADGGTRWISISGAQSNTFGFCYFVVGLFYAVRRGNMGILNSWAWRRGCGWGGGDRPKDGYGDDTFSIVNLFHYR